MTPQEIFDTVATHLFTQGVRAAREDGFSVYRTPEGLKCAVGCLIPDSDYDFKMECGTINELIDSNYLPDDVHEVFADNRGLLRRLQVAHDVSHDWDSSENMTVELNCVAAEFGLSPSILANLSFKDR